MPKGPSSSTSDNKSQLKTGAERFLAQAITHALDDGWRTADDFLRHFKPLDIMTGLEKAPDLRAELLIKGAGVHEKIARKKSTSSASEDLRIALDEQVTSPSEVLGFFPVDDRVRYLDRARLWTFVTEDQFWSGDGKGGDRAIERMTFMLKTALSEALVTLQDIADGIGFETISKRLPMAELQKVVLHAMKTGRNKAALTEESLLEVVPLRDLVSYIPLEQTWKRVIVAKVAQPANFVSGPAPGNDEGWEGGSVAPSPNSKTAKTEEAKVAPPEPEAKVEAAPPKEEAVEDRSPPKRSAPPPPPKPVKEPVKETSVVKESPAAASASNEDVDQLLHSSRSGPEEEARRRVAERLKAINRLPPRHDDLSTPILLSIESMYADLLSAPTDEAREGCIRDSFPNEGHLTTALLALIQLLDPSIDVNDPVIKDADVDSLIKVVLFEERHRYEQAHPSMRPLSPPPPPPNPRRSVTPPPLPRSGGAVPPPLPEKR